MSKIAHLPQQRVMRVFVSSTFQDMHAEREELVKRVFPQLRKRCEERGVTWVEVDLRWGITDEEAQESKVLSICFEEINKCRPFFIGLLGERYGWVPSVIPEELIAQEHWMSEYPGRSVTEYEILHGALNTPDQSGCTFFYFRDADHVEHLPPEVDQAIFKAENKIAQHKLSDLKRRIRMSNLPVRENYPNVRSLGEMVLSDLTNIIEQIFPANAVIEPLDREAEEHAAFAASRTKVYVDRQSYFDCLNEHAHSDSPPLVVVGAPGSGKSALLANWVKQYGSDPDRISSAITLQASKPISITPVLTHFIGATATSSNWTVMLRHLMGELRRHYRIEQEIPDKSDALRSAFLNWLEMAAVKGRLIIVLDALDKLEDHDGALDLLWLPSTLPTNMRLIMSTLPGRSLDEAKARGWSLLQVEPLHQEERNHLITKYLGLYRKILSKTRIDRIISAHQSANPLFLRTLLEELRVFGIHEQLDARIDHYLAALTIDDLYGKVLQRYEEDYEHDRPGLVRDTFSLLWAARSGLSEAELLDLLSTKKVLLSRAIWSPLYLTVEAALTNRNGLLGFSHDYFRRAVQDRYLDNEQDRNAARLRLADYFEARERGSRKIRELPWQLSHARAWERLTKLLADKDFLAACWQADQFDVKSYWTQIEEHSLFRVVLTYRGILDAPALYVEYVDIIAQLLDDLGYQQEALFLQSHIVELYRQIDTKKLLATALNHKALILNRQGDPENALTALYEAAQIFGDLHDKDGKQRTQFHIAMILHRQGHWKIASLLYEEAEQICRELADKQGLIAILVNRGTILAHQDDWDGAKVKYQEAEQLCRELGDRANLLKVLLCQLDLRKRQGNVDGIMSLYQEIEEGCYKLGDKRTLVGMLIRKALILKERGNLTQSMLLLKQAESISSQMGNLHAMASSILNQSIVLMGQQDTNGALEQVKKARYIFSQIDDKLGETEAILFQVKLLVAVGNRHEAYHLIEEIDHRIMYSDNNTELTIESRRLRHLLRSHIH
jgi:tetratricopeptide (TPR) repeat protein